MNYENLKISELFNLLDEKQNQIEMIIELLKEREKNAWDLSKCEYLKEETRNDYKAQWISTSIILNQINNIID
jgi:hypothetical protein